MRDTCHEYPQKLRSDLCSEIKPVSNLFRRIKEKGKGFLKAGSRLMVMMV